MHPQLEALSVEYLEALDRLHALARRVPVEEWPYRTDQARWSVAECVAHLNLTSEACIPLLCDGVATATALGVPASARHRHSVLGWLLWRTMGPPVRMRVPTAPPFVPATTAPAEALIAEFERHQDALVALVRAGDGLPLSRVRITSPFNARVRYNLYSAFAIVVRHQHRHLWQAEQVWANHRG